MYIFKDVPPPPPPPPIWLLRWLICAGPKRNFPFPHFILRLLKFGHWTSRSGRNWWNQCFHGTGIAYVMSSNTVSQHKSHLCTFVAFFTTKNSNFHIFVVKCQVAIRIYDLVKFSRIPGLEGGVGGGGGVKPIMAVLRFWEHWLHQFLPYLGLMKTVKWRKEILGSGMGPVITIKWRIALWA